MSESLLIRGEPILRCARKAFPGREWWLNTFDEACSSSGEFCLTCGDDQMALQIALMKDGWHFGPDGDAFYASDEGHPDKGQTMFTSQDFAELLMLCMSATPTQEGGG